MTNKLIVGDKNSTGYLRVCLYNKNHAPPKQRFFRHRLVAEAFIPNPNNLPEVNHKNKDRNDCSVSNLEWCTRLYNERHSIRLSSKYKPYKVTYINGTQQTFEFQQELADILHITKGCIGLWLRHDNKGYLKYGILNIEYIKSKQLKV